MKSNSLDVVVVDSVAALAPRAELEGEMGQSHVGLQARLMSQALRKLVAANHSRCICIFTNQIREKVGVMFGSPETTPGGRALKFYSLFGWIFVVLANSKIHPEKSTGIAHALKWSKKSSRPFHASRI